VGIQARTISQLTKDRDGQATTISQLTKDRDDQATTILQLTKDRDGQATTISDLTKDRDGQAATILQLTKDRDAQALTIQQLLAAKAEWDKMKTMFATAAEVAAAIPSAEETNATIDARVQPMQYATDAMLACASKGLLFDIESEQCLLAEADECRDNNGGCQQVCTDKIGGYTCSCDDGWVISKEDPNKCVAKCSSNPCHDGVDCTDTDTGTFLESCAPTKYTRAHTHTPAYTHAHTHAHTHTRTHTHTQTNKHIHMHAHTAHTHTYTHKPRTHTHTRAHANSTCSLAHTLRIVNLNARGL